MLLDININKLTKLIESFYKLTQIKVAVYDDGFQEIFTYPQEYSPFCEMMNRTPAIRKNCQASVRALCERCRSQKRLVTFTCHAGLTEAAAPLYENNIVIGYIMFGQITNTKDRAEFLTRAKSLYKNYPLDQDEFDSKILTVPYKDNEQLMAASEIIHAFTAYIHLEHIVALKKDETLSSLIEYIDHNLSADLSTGALCERFSVSKSVLYELTKPAMPDGIAKYIRRKRLQKAKELISETDASIEEISGLVGFIDSNYFRRVFKQENGMSANTYRKRAKHSALSG